MNITDWNQNPKACLGAFMINTSKKHINFQDSRNDKVWMKLPGRAFEEQKKSIRSTPEVLGVPMDRRRKKLESKIFRSS